LNNLGFLVYPNKKAYFSSSNDVTDIGQAAQLIFPSWMLGPGWKQSVIQV